mmetsp:Transcript_26025/g.54015  ORF Transcript_26025/g.54015 Transcript_26025/m.54015 type:complete len:206 (-) Transcript_26025:1863-2480(-)
MTTAATRPMTRAMHAARATPSPVRPVGVLSLGKTAGNVPVDRQRGAQEACPCQSRRRMSSHLPQGSAAGGLRIRMTFAVRAGVRPQQETGVRSQGRTATSAPVVQLLGVMEVPARHRQRLLRKQCKRRLRPPQHRNRAPRHQHQRFPCQHHAQHLCQLQCQRRPQPRFQLAHQHPLRLCSQSHQLLHRQFHPRQRRHQQHGMAVT